MTPAEFKTIRESLGLSAKALADILGISQERTIRRWEDASRALPEDAADRLLELDVEADRMAEHGRRMCLAHPDAVIVTVLRYERPEDYPETSYPHAHRVHAAALGRLKRVAPDRVRIVAFDAERYRAWLGSRKDSIALRAAWGAEQV